MKKQWHIWIKCGSIQFFNKWQIFRNDPGYANTNSSIESFNATFKREYTKYYKCTMLSACRKILNCIKDYSDSTQKRNIYYKIPRYVKEIKEKANGINADQFTSRSSRSTRVQYTGYNETKYVITLNDPNCYANCSCRCEYFLKWAICHHFVAYSHCIEKNWYGMKYNILEKFQINTKKGAK
jgi:hypothetical protein